MHVVDIPPIVEARISGSTYPKLGWAAIDLYAKIQAAISKFADPDVDFGTTALDIGSRDARYIPVIKELGPTQVTAIDPSDELQLGIDCGLITPEQAFHDTVEAYLEQYKGNQADSIFILNINPGLPRNPGFVDATMELVKPGGLVVSSCVERETSIDWAAVTHWEGKLNEISMRPQPSDKDNSQHKTSHEIDQGGGPNHFLSISRRTNV